MQRRRCNARSEVLSDPSNPLSPTNFFITVDGATPELFNPNNPPAIVTTQGSVEDWTIQNRSGEVHEFHIHQIHFLLLAVNGVPVPAQQQQFLDMINVPYWTGAGPYPSVTVRMDFRGSDIGDFVYHCHILGHEDNGMMAIVRVNPRSDSTRRTTRPFLVSWLDWMIRKPDSSKSIVPASSKGALASAMCIRGKLTVVRRMAAP
jgi:Multicopper oxidase